MAILLALAKQRGSSLCDTIFGYVEPTVNISSFSVKTDDVRMKQSGIQVCALVDCNGTPEEVSQVVSQMVAEGFTTIKLKVRYTQPIILFESPGFFFFFFFCLPQFIS